MDLVCETFGVQVLSSLGGRMNQHWLVDRTGEQQVLRRWAEQPAESISYEIGLVSGLARMGWPVAPLSEPIEIEGCLWSLSPFIPGETPEHGGPAEQRARGRLLAELHLATRSLPTVEQRPGWRRGEEILSDPELDRILSANEARREDEVGIVRWHLDRSRQLIEGLDLEDRPAIPIHGDFAPWNLRFREGRLTGLIDFELARNDHRVADFGLSWRGKYDDVIYGYNEVSPLEPEEWTMITPVWWASLIEDACRNMCLGIEDDSWTVGKLLTRSAMMGADAAAMPT